MASPHGAKPIRVDLYIIDENRNYFDVISRFDWKSMVNGGFIVKCTLFDANFKFTRKIFDDSEAKYLRSARAKPTAVKFRISYDNGLSTPYRHAIIADLNARGSHAFGQFTFVAVDPISYYLNWGDASGKAFHGKIGGGEGVVKQVLDKYIPSSFNGTSGKITIKKEVADTTDIPSSYWMMRQDPKTFIMSLLEWSNPFTKHKTSWLVTSGEINDEIFIKIVESHVLKMGSVSLSDEKVNGGTEDRETGDLIFTLGSDIVYGWSMMCDHLLSTYNTKLVTSGISAVSGEYYDQISDPEEKYVYVTDKNTGQKLVPRIKVQQGYTKPEKGEKGWSYVHSIPEFGNAEPTLQYKDYISGRARQQYLDMLNLVMRMKITVRGEPRLHAADELGQTKVILNWPDLEDSKQRMMHGNWLLYGWHHKYRVESPWKTDVYLARLDWNAKGIPGSG
jgi:hypothetical protein